MGQLTISIYRPIDCVSAPFDRCAACPESQTGGTMRLMQSIGLPRPKRRITSRDPRPAKKGDGELWHRRMGHAGPMAVHKLGGNCLGVKLIGPKIVQCQPCSQAKIKRQEARRIPLRHRSTPGLEIHIDWTDVEESYDGLERTMFCTDSASGMVSPYL